MQCIYCEKLNTGGVQRIRTHLPGDASMKKCAKAPREVVTVLSDSKKELNDKDRLKMQRDFIDKATKISAVAAAIQLKLTQSIIQSIMTTGAKSSANVAVSRLFMHLGRRLQLQTLMFLKDGKKRQRVHRSNVSRQRMLYGGRRNTETTAGNR